MQYSTLLTLATSLALTNASPRPRNNVAKVIFKGAADAQYTIFVPVDGQEHATSNVLSVSSVMSNDIDVSRFCSLRTVDYPPALVATSANSWNVGPPQTVNTIKCWEGTNPNEVETVTIDFQGADPAAKYTLNVKLDGSVVPTNNALSISTIVTGFEGLPDCTFRFVDHEAALSKIAPNTYAVGPPQTIESISCKQ